MTQKGLWIIGYGSLIFKPPPLYAFRVTGTLLGYIRRFWQSSSDHRGTPESPGRVVTLIPLEDLQKDENLHFDMESFEGNNKSVSELVEDDLAVWGVAYYIESKNVAEVIEYMDVREQDGYTSHTVHFKVHEIPTNNDVAAEVLPKIPIDVAGHRCIESTVYIGTIHNESFVGPEHISATAQVIRTSKGPSGRNVDYLRLLTEAVRELCAKNEDSKDAYLESLLELSS